MRSKDPRPGDPPPMGRARLAVPFNRPTEVGGELKSVAEAVRNQSLSGDGPFTKRCQASLEDALGVPKVLLTTSCTHALELAALLLDFKTGDEVIVPPFTFVSTVNSFLLRGAVPVFVDVRPDTLNLDERLVEERIGPRTRAIVPIHYGGVAAALGHLLDIAGRHGLVLLEDSAHGLFGRFEGRWLGSVGQLASLSFHETKNFTCGEGGALLINDPDLVERAVILREKGTNRSQFFRGEVDKYTWVDFGSSYLPSELLAAYLFPQLQAWTTVQARREAVWRRYMDALAPWAAEHGVQLPMVPAGVEPSYHLFHMVLPSPTARARLLEHLRRESIHATFHYQPLHLSKMGRSMGGRPGQHPVTERVCDCLVRLPFYTSMNSAEQERVIEEVLAFRP